MHYRAALLCALVLLVATPRAFSAETDRLDVNGAKVAAASSSVAASSLAARQPDSAIPASIAQAGVAASAGAHSDEPSATTSALPKTGPASPGSAAPKAAAAAAPTTPSSKGAQPQPQQPQQQQQQKQPAAVPTVSQPAAPQPVGAKPGAAAQPQPAATQQQQQQPEPQTELLSSNAQAIDEAQAEVSYYEPGTSKYYPRKSGVQPSPKEGPSGYNYKAYTPGSKPPGNNYNPYYNSKAPGYNSPGNGPYPYPPGSKPGQYPGAGYYKNDSKPGAYSGPGYDRYTGPYNRPDGKYDGKHDPRYDGKYDGKWDGKYDGKHDGKWDGKWDGKYGDHGHEEHDAKALHHTGKAAKKLYKAKEAEKYLSDNYGSHDPHYKPDSAYKHSEQAVTQDADMPLEGSLGEGPADSKEKEKLLKLQKYYQAEAELLESQLEDADDGISSFARPSKYSSKAAKYAAMALKAQKGGKPTAAQAQADKSGLAGFAAAFMKKKPVLDKTTTVMYVPKPTLKGAVAGDAAQTQGAAAPEAALEGSADPLGEEISYEEYLANPQLYAGIPGGLPAGATLPKDGVMVVTHEQYHLGSSKKPHGGKKAAANAQKQQGHAAGMPGAAGPDAAAQLQGYGGSDPRGYSGADYYKKGSKDGYADPYGYGGYGGGPDFDFENNYQPPLRRKEAKNVYNFRSVPGSQRIRLGYTMGPGGVTDTGGRPVVIAYTSKMTCGDGPTIGTCTGTGIMPSDTDRTQDTLMTFTCSIDADASNICGLKYVQGMTVTAQGVVTVTIDEDDRDTVSKLDATVLPITGVYVPGRRTTLLADVITLLSGVKGGSLMLRSDGELDGHFSFYFWR